MKDVERVNALNKMLLNANVVAFDQENRET